METYRKVIGSYEASVRKKGFDASLFFVKYLYRPLSFPFTVIFLKLKFTANQVTILNGIMVLISFIFLTYGGPYYSWLGIVLYFAFYIMDFIDGNIARYHHWTSFMGKLIDGFVDTFGYIVFIPIAFGLPDNSYLLSKDNIITLAIMTSLFEILLQCWRLRLAYFLLKIEVNSKSQSETGNTKVKAIPKKKGFVSNLIKIAKSLRVNILCGLPVFIILFNTFNRLDLLIIFFSILIIPLGIAEIIVSALRNKKVLLETTTRIAY